MNVTNHGDIPLSLAVWLLHDDYDYNNDPNYISATSLMKPIKSIVLAPRVPKEDLPPPDLEDMIPSSLGNSIHDSIQKAWETSYASAFRKMGYSQSVIDRIKINPNPKDMEPDTIPVHIEQRHHRKAEGRTIGGKYDMVFDGQVQDHKSTSAWAWVFGTRNDEYILQGSIYRWLAPHVITEDAMQVNFIFTDWQKSMANRKEEYPNSRLEKLELKLLSEAETEKWVKNKLRMVKKYMNSPEEGIPECTEEELWMSETVYKYYKNPKAARATKNFSDVTDAHIYMMEKGKGQGIIEPVFGKPKRCEYCPAFPICEQRKRMLPDE